VKKRRKPEDSFKRALADANKKLALALKLRGAAQKHLADLNIEIPALERTIAALGGQVNPSPILDKKGVMPNEQGTIQTPIQTHTTSAVTGDTPSGDESVKQRVEQVTKALVGVGSIPNNSGPQATAPDTEEAYLHPPTEIVGEDLDLPGVEKP
jgi:hypothetical protein